jgi:TonB-dependent SusC/RagA subfamily outer membrane receptor
MRLFYAFLISFLFANSSFAQNKLSKSRVSSQQTLIYRLTDQDMVDIYNKPNNITDKFFHSLVDSFSTGKGYKKKLAFGNYIYVSADRENLVYRVNPENNVSLKFINNLKEFQFYITDLKGNLIKNAQVEIGKGKRVNFDANANLYQTSYPNKEQLIKVIYNGVSNFYTYDYNKEDDKPRYYKSSKYKPSNYKPQKQLYAGYMVFSKPRYKPYDTVKFKAYITKANGSPISIKDAQAVLLSDGKDKVLTTLKPYTNGGYEYNFVLSDSLNLRLDRSYTVKLVDKNSKKEDVLISSNFRYEDYELKALTFSVRLDKDEHSKKNPASIYMKAVDENDLAVPDGRVEIIATANQTIYAKESVFIPNLLWKKEMNLEPVGETKLILPDSIFPNANFSFNLQFKFKNSNNETRNAYKTLNYKHVLPNEIEKELKSSLVADSLSVDYLEDGKSVKQKAFLVLQSAEGENLDSLMVNLPAKIKIDYRAENYFFKLENGFKKSVSLYDFNTDISVNAYQNKDSLYVKINNQHKIPFWYTIYSGNSILKKGYTTNLDTLIKHSSAKAAHIRINYYWDDKERYLETSAYYQANLLNVKLIAPDVVYPGQKVNMLVKVTDSEDKPVTETDLTAYASTSKFTDNYSPRLPYFGKSFSVRTKKIKLFEEEAVTKSGNLPLNWQKWSKQLALDTIEYYKFTNHQSIYKITESTNDTTTQVAPFAILDGKILPVSIVYINFNPVYFDQVDQLNRYSFIVKPGKISLILRTLDREITINDVVIEKGKKTILSVSAKAENPIASVKNVSKELSVGDSDFLNNRLIRVENTFGDLKTKLTENTEVLVNKPENIFSKESFLLGPFQDNYLTLKNSTVDHTFIKEPGYTYTFLPKLIKQKSYHSKYAFNPNFDQVGIKLANYLDYAIKQGEIDSIWNDYLDLRSRTTSLFSLKANYDENSGRISLTLDTTLINRKPFVKNIIINKVDDFEFLQIYPGNTRYFQNLEAGDYKITFLLKDNSYYSVNKLQVKSKGQNIFYFKDLKLKKSDDWSINLDKSIKSVQQTSRYGESKPISQTVLENFNDNKFDESVLKKTMSGTVTDKESNPLPGVSVKVFGLKYGVSTDASGNFSIRIPDKGKVVFSYIGFESTIINAKEGNAGKIKLKESSSMLQEVIVTGYGVTQKKEMMTGSVSTMLEGKLAGVAISPNKIMLRGANSIDAKTAPLVIVDGLPYSGDVKSLNSDDIADMVILKAEDATAIYGSRASNGVIIIKTKKGNTQTQADGTLASAEQSLRKNFNDVAFWQPKLTTDQSGTAKFTVTFPDDITNWKARVIAMNGKKQSGFTETYIKSFKSISANFVSPLFAVQGDSIKVLGKLMNYTPLEEQGTRKFKYNGQELLNSKVNFKNAKIDTIPIYVKGTDSLNFEYTLTQDNGYFDGEQRKIPVYKPGVIETKGFFNVLISDTTINYTFDKNLGRVTLRAEASIFPTLLDEMNKLRNYEYLCNEQLASKLKSLLLEKKVFTLLEKPFKYERDIKEIIKKLQNNRKAEGTWSWWPNGAEEMWISLHATEALLQAQKDGYTVDVNKQLLYTYLVSKLADGKRHDQNYLIKLLNLLDERNSLKNWVNAYEKKLRADEKSTEIKLNLYQQLELLQLQQMAGLHVNLEPYVKLKKHTMFGAVYWGDQSYRFWDNSIQNTLLMYKILKRQGGYDAELEKIVLYFLEQRKDGQWRNTYESSLILETILPQLLKNKVKDEPAYIEVNNKRIDKFPYDDVLDSNSEVKVKKGGKMAVYFTGYQQFISPKPEKVDKDFKVNTSFVQNGKTVSRLKAGELSTLKVEVEVRADADYVMIEIPIPAGCSYENKMQSFWGVETHREYFKNKTVIFSNKLKQGKYTFNIDLMPRYSGSYVLNPAKAEMMYFPVFYGREGMKKVGVN